MGGNIQTGGAPSNGMFSGGGNPFGSILVVLNIWGVLLASLNYHGQLLLNSYEEYLNSIGDLACSPCIKRKLGS
jgi:hypothetical protein